MKKSQEKTEDPCDTVRSCNMLAMWTCPTSEFWRHEDALGGGGENYKRHDLWSSFSILQLAWVFKICFWHWKVGSQWLAKSVSVILLPTPQSPGPPPLPRGGWVLSDVILPKTIETTDEATKCMSKSHGSYRGDAVFMAQLISWCSLCGTSLSSGFEEDKNYFSNAVRQVLLWFQQIYCLFCWVFERVKGACWV